LKLNLLIFKSAVEERKKLKPRSKFLNSTEKDKKSAQYLIKSKRKERICLDFKKIHFC
jgi:hypothetical protein